MAEHTAASGEVHAGRGSLLGSGYVAMPALSVSVSCGRAQSWFRGSARRKRLFAGQRLYGVAGTLDEHAYAAEHPGDRLPGCDKKEKPSRSFQTGQLHCDDSLKYWAEHSVDDGHTQEKAHHCSWAATGQLPVYNWANLPLFWIWLLDVLGHCLCIVGPACLCFGSGCWMCWVTDTTSSTVYMVPVGRKESEFFNQGKL